MKVLLWMPSGADLKPLDKNVNNNLKTVLKNKGLSPIQKLKSEPAIALRKMSESKVIGKIAEPCRAIPKRARWAPNLGAVAKGDLEEGPRDCLGKRGCSQK